MVKKLCMAKSLQYMLLLLSLGILINSTKQHYVQDTVPEIINDTKITKIIPTQGASCSLGG